MAVMPDLLALIHGLSVITFWVIVPLVLLATRRRVRRLENVFIVVSGVAGISFLITGECLLTTWEQQLRIRFVPATAYTGGFISAYLARVGITWPDALTFPLAVMLTSLGWGRSLLLRCLDRTPRR